MNESVHTEQRVLPDDPVLVAAARAAPGQWVYDIDRPYPPDQPVPPEAIRGSWQVDGSGRLTGQYARNARYRAIEPNGRAGFSSRTCTLPRRPIATSGSSRPIHAAKRCFRRSLRTSSAVGGLSIERAGSPTSSVRTRSGPPTHRPVMSPHHERQLRWSDLQGRDGRDVHGPVPVALRTSWIKSSSRPSASRSFDAAVAISLPTTPARSSFRRRNCRSASPTRDARRPAWPMPIESSCEPNRKIRRDEIDEPGRIEPRRSARYA